MLRLGHDHIVLVVIVAIEKVLDRGASELKLRFSDSFRVLPLRVVHVVAIEVIDRGVGHVGCLHRSAFKLFPGELSSFKPRVRLELFNSIFVANSRLRLALNALVDEVCALLGPTWRHVSALDLDLLAENLLPDFAPILSNVRSTAHHAIVADDANREIVRDRGVILAAHYLRSHVAWRT